MLKGISYKIKVLARIILILGLGFAAIIVITQTHFWSVSIWIALVMIMLIVELFIFLQRSRNALKEFLLSVNQEDFSNLYPADESDAEIIQAYRLILDKFRDLRIKKESHYHYLLRIVENVDTALICLDHHENVQLINKSAKELLKIPDIKDLKPLIKIDKKLVAKIRDIRSGQKELVRVIRQGKLLNISLRATEFILENEKLKLVTLQDIKSELEEQEVESWQKLVRILTHEIMNSTVPITNMVAIAREILADTQSYTKPVPGLSEEEINDLVESLKTAELRGKGLMNFVKTTKSLTQISKPSFRDVSINKLFSRIHKLFKPETDQKKIQLKIIYCQPDILIKADLELLEQVIINLIRNAIEAFGQTIDPVIELGAGDNFHGKTFISVLDNGPGIEKDQLDQIFIPFFSTKKNGSGIGLSLSRQIMKLHKGRIEVQSEPGTGSCFTLEI
jgi:two-component system nitrogen regulation sensor histidine kinase NtrY